MRGNLLGGLAVATPTSLPRRRRRHYHHSPTDDGDAQPLPPMLPVLQSDCYDYSSSLISILSLEQKYAARADQYVPDSGDIL